MVIKEVPPALNSFVGDESKEETHTLDMICTLLDAGKEPGRKSPNGL
jgi:hypothetical protein